MMTISNTKYEFQFPASDAKIKCNPDEGYTNTDKVTFFGVTTLTASNVVGSKPGCAVGRNPGVYILEPQVIYHSFGVFDAEQSPGGGWRLMSTDDFVVNKRQKAKGVCC